MKKILIVIPAFNHGGTNRSLLNLLNIIDQSRFTIQVLSMDYRGPYRDLLMNDVLLPENCMLSACASFGKPFKNEGLWGGIRRLFWKVIYKTIFRGQEERLFQASAKKYNAQQYDVVVSFQEGQATRFASQIDTPRRVAWVHCDYSIYQQITGNKDELVLYEHFNHIVCVSNYTAEIFKGFYPELAGRTCAIHNLIDANGIIFSSTFAQDDLPFERDGLSIVSVGRMDPVKRFTFIPPMAQRMKQNGCKFKWYLIGSGGKEFDKVRNSIQEYDVAEEVILLGTKKNPYPYIAAADILVCPSYSEACPNVVNEAKVLHVPVVAADFPSAKEYIDDGVNGVIIPIEEMADALIRLYNNKQFLDDLRTGIGKFEYKNENIIQLVETLFYGGYE